MMMFPAFTHTATRKRSLLFESRVERESKHIQYTVFLFLVMLHLLLMWSRWLSLLPAGWAISIQATEDTSTCLKRGSIRTALSLEPRFLRSSQFGASETCSGIRGVLFTPLTKLVTLFLTSTLQPCYPQHPLSAVSSPNSILHLPIPIAVVAVVTSFEAN